jgi:ribosomal protein S18 acetylase RimI-like enzyme
MSGEPRSRTTVSAGRLLIRELSADDLETARAAAELHSELLPGSPATALGPGFLGRYYYRTLVRLGLVFGAVAWVDGRPAGFIAATSDSSGFMRRGIRRNPVRLAVEVLRALGQRPRRATALLELVRIMRGRRSSEITEGEILSFGVRPEFRAASFAGESGIRLAEQLHQAAITELQARGVRGVIALVEKDNLEARLAYRAAGWEQRTDDIPGWKTPLVEMFRELEPPG